MRPASGGDGLLVDRTGGEERTEEKKRGKRRGEERGDEGRAEERTGESGGLAILHLSAALHGNCLINELDGNGTHY